MHPEKCEPILFHIHMQQHLYLCFIITYAREPFLFASSLDNSTH